MRKILQTIDNMSPKLLFWCIVALAIVLAARIQAIQHGWINPDSVLYFESAKLITTGNLSGAYKIFPWPFYSICIAAIHELTSLNIHMSAQLLNMLFFGLATASFLRIIQLADGGNYGLVAGTLLLFGNLYIVGDVLEMLLRDEGFWAFYLTSLVFFINFYQREKMLDAILWQLTAMLAVLFRVEAISFLLFLPLILLFSSETPVKKRVLKFTKAYSISILVFASIAIAIAVSDTLSIESFGRLKEVFSTNIWQELTRQLITKSEVMSQQVLGKYLEEFALPGLLLTFLYVLLVKAISGPGLISTGMAAVFIKKSSALMPSNVRHILTTAAAIAIFNMMLIITKVFVLSGRYVVALTFIILIFAALYLAHLFKQLSHVQKPRLVWLLGAIVLVMLLGLVKNILPKKPGYNYMQDAVTWLKANNKNKSVFYDDSRIRYYAGAPFVGTWPNNWQVVSSAIQNKTINQYEFLVISQSIKHPEREKLMHEQLPQYIEIKRFGPQKPVKSIVIYQKKTP